MKRREAIEARAWRRVIGIVGGLGPHAHLELERELLRAVDWAERDQQYPAWVLASLPRTPDRTEALLAGGDSPVPLLAEAVEAISARADFAVIACITAHAFLPELRPKIDLPVLDIVEEAVRVAAAEGHRRIGILATSGTLASGIFRHAAERVAPGVELLSPLDLPEGEALQRELVMRPIYGEPVGSAPSIKAGGTADPAGRARLARPLTDAVSRLSGAGAGAVILGCTELPLALGHEPIDGVALIDPIRAAARAAVEIALGRRELPGG